MHKTSSGENGMTLVETMCATLIMAFGLLAMCQALVFSVMVSKSYGRDATQATAAAHDKMQELTGLQFADTTTNVSLAAPYPTNGVGLRAGGSIPPAGAVTGYVDYVNFSGVRTNQADSAYTRQWQIIDDAANIKRIIVAVTSNRSFRTGEAPSTTLVTCKTR